MDKLVCAKIWVLYKPLETLMSTPHSSGVAISLKRVGVGLGVGAKYLNEEFLVDLNLLQT